MKTVPSILAIAVMIISAILVSQQQQQTVYADSNDDDKIKVIVKLIKDGFDEEGNVNEALIYEDRDTFQGEELKFSDNGNIGKATFVFSRDEISAEEFLACVVSHDDEGSVGAFCRIGDFEFNADKTIVVFDLRTEEERDRLIVPAD
jgi:hypothetical protein